MSNIKVEFVNVTKKFGDFTANDSVAFSITANEIHAIFGENGAGKSTMMSILFGLYVPDSGHIKINGEQTRINNPRQANSLRIAMLPQHFNLIDNATVWENVILGYEDSRFILDKKNAAKKIHDIQAKYGIYVDINSKVSSLAVSDKQKVELLKILWNDAEILIFDEPTAILTPNQIVNFLKMLRDLKKAGKTIILITHKLAELREIAERCTVIRKGKVIKTVVVSEVSNLDLVELMIGEKIPLNLDIIPKFKVETAKKMLSFEHVSYIGKQRQVSLDSISFDVYSGEIIGVASIQGNGESEFFKLISGLLKPTKGRVSIAGRDITNWSVKKRYHFKESIDYLDAKEFEQHSLISHIPEDRQIQGLVLGYNISMNSVLQDLKQYSKFGVISHKKIDDFAKELVRRYDIRGIDAGVNRVKAKALSGGNQQKLIVGREVERNSEVLIAFNPTRGLDVGAIKNIYENIIHYRNKGGAVVFYSNELDEIMEVSDRVIVLYKGKKVIQISTKELTKYQVGMLMTQGAISDTSLIPKNSYVPTEGVINEQDIQ